MALTAFKNQPRLDGIFDWFFRKKKEQAGLPAPVQEPRPSVVSVFAPKEAPTPQPESIVEIFRPREIIPLQPREILRPEPAGPVAEVVKPPSLVEVFRPGAPSEIAEFVAPSAIVEVFKPGAPMPLAEMIAPQEMVEIFKPPEDFEARKTKQMELWAGLPEEEEGPEAYEAFKPGEIRDPEVVSSELVKRYGYDPDGIKILPLPPRDTLLPTPEEVARGWLAWAGEELWDYLRGLDQDRNWQEEVAQYADDPESYEYPPFWGLESLSGSDSHDQPPTGIEGLAVFFGIHPEEVYRIGEAVFDKYGEVEDWGNYDAIMDGIIYPLMEIFRKAMELIAPKDLYGFMDIMDCADCGMAFNIVYVDLGENNPAVQYSTFSPEPEPEPEPEPLPKPKPKKKRKKKKR